MENSNFRNLVHIDDVTQYSEKENSKLFDEIVNCLVVFDKLERFSVTLLHYHFNLRNNEFISEYLDKNDNTISINVVDKKLINNYQPVSWRLENKNNELNLIPIQYRLKSDELSMTKSDYLCLDNISNILDKYDVQNQFGICFRRPLFESNDEFIMMESTDEEERIQLLYPDRTITEKELEKSVQTSWAFDKENLELINGLWCKKRSTTYCSTSCRTRCRGNYDGHDRTHLGRGHKKTKRYTHFS